MFKLLSFLVIFCLVKSSNTLICYNCSSTHRSWEQCGGQFAVPAFVFNNSRHYLINCTGENSLCFVRSWSKRAKHSWIVQRGCYQISADDPLPRAMNTPTRAMTCKYERLADAEYKVCLCNANWCNRSRDLNGLLRYSNYIYFILYVSLFYVA